MTTVTVHHAKTHLSKLIAAAERGEEVVIARGNKPAVRLVPVDSPVAVPKPVRKPGRLKGIIAFDETFFDPLPEKDLLLWEGNDGRDD
ncbi:antitoxin [Brevundimonas sp. LM2]|uniref:type II toxin-antitoxin system Phd/YefM family antitoxin n=1 Tax=Brevundimonas sp. LM2 TaxID=1938605 RepID=UPI0009840456|nr:type II toxin-antitoxin system prevent-host-death family antitoxin [Brevundimonas sp. LM2]AQR61032.1 antitoxin [Brevundimonas sp. LM2]